MNDVLRNNEGNSKYYDKNVPYISGVLDLQLIRNICMHSPNLGNVNTKTVKLQKNKQRGGVKIDDFPLELFDIEFKYNPNFLKPSLGIFSDKTTRSRYSCRSVWQGGCCVRQAWGHQHGARRAERRG